MSDEDPHRVLARNAACHQCRRRKLKCDAQRPACANCLKPRQRGPIKDAPPEPCTWDESRDHSVRSAGRKREPELPRPESAPQTSNGNDGSSSIEDSKKRARLERLDRVEDRIAQVEQRLKSGLDTPPTNDGSMPPPGLPLSSELPASSSINSPDLMQWLGSLPMDIPSVPLASAGLDSTTDGYDFPTMPSSSTYELMWPDWPRDLPTFDVVERIIQVFYERVPTIPKMIHKATLLNSLQFPPSHPKFPAVTLLHAILAVTAPFLSPATLGSRAYFPTGASASDTVHPEYDFTPRLAPQSSTVFSFNMYAKGDLTPLTRFQMWHRRKSFEALADHFTTGSKLLQCAQALVTVTTVDVMNAWWTDLWMESACAVRIAIPMYLNLSPNVAHNPLKRNPTEMLGTPQTPLEQAERDRTWWMIYIMEKTSICGTSWPSAISDEEITLELPVRQSTFDESNGPGNFLGSQTLHSTDLLSFHPPEHIDSFAFLVKACKVFTDTNVFIRRYSRGSHTYARYLADPTLRRCLADINAFRLSFPAQLRRPMQRLENGRETIDPELFTAITMTHAAVLNLGEPLITQQTWSDDAARMTLSAVRAILSLIYDVNGTTYDLTLLPPANSFMWCLASRCLVRFINAAKVSNDTVSVSVFESELLVFRMALTQYGERHPVGLRHIKIIDMLKIAAEQDGTDVRFDCSKDQVFDREYSILATRKNANVSAYTSPSSYLSPSGLTPAASSSSNLPTMTSSSTLSASPSVGHPIGRASQPVFSLGSLSGEPKSESSSAAATAALASGTSDAPEWIKDFDGFDISSFAFDVEAMAKYVSGTDPNASFNGSEYCFPSF